MTSELRILVVDDDDAIRALLQTVLRRRGLRVDGARNGVDALEQLGANVYALVVLDLMMPRMNGYELLDHLSRQSILARPRVLVLTAGVDTRLISTDIASADLVIGTVHKPFDIEMLVDIVTSYLSASAPEPMAPPETSELRTLN
ncbi:MAG TPA: response regulator [Thermoanaerobaculia bacterium]|jgi:DNA-binding response OmpR family regulator